MEKQKKRYIEKEVRMDKKYYDTCPYCKAHLDPGELCDCTGAIAEREKRTNGGNEDGK